MHTDVQLLMQVEQHMQREAWRLHNTYNGSRRGCINPLQLAISARR